MIMNQGETLLFQDVQTDLAGRWVGRDETIDATLLAILGGENLLLTGPKGTAKSDLTTDIFRRFPWLNRFKVPLSENVDPDSVLGRTAIDRITKGDFTRDVTDRLPGVHLAFLDELTRGAQGLLDSLLPIMQERQFPNDGKMQDVPLRTLVAAANHDLQQISELPGWYDALADRFVYRNHVSYVSGTMLDQLLNLAINPPNGNWPTVDEATFKNAAATVPHVTVPGEINKVFRMLHGKIGDVGVTISDRRWMQCIRVLRTSAVFYGRGTVDLTDAWALRHVLTGSGQEDADAEIVNMLRQIADPSGPILAEVLNFIAKVKKALADKSYGESLDERTKWATKTQADLRSSERTVQKSTVPQAKKEATLNDITTLRRQIMDDVLGLELGGLKF
jgi:MoxR-like ATPase